VAIVQCSSPKPSLRFLYDHLHRLVSPNVQDGDSSLTLRLRSLFDPTCISGPNRRHTVDAVTPRSTNSGQVRRVVNRGPRVHEIFQGTTRSNVRQPQCSVVIASCIIWRNSAEIALDQHGSANHGSARQLRMMNATYGEQS
jgi:hypothetical protein